MFTKASYVVAALAAVAHAQDLTKPALDKDLGALQDGLMASIGSVPQVSKKWPAGWIPADCKRMTEEANLSPTDVETFEVQYTDCVSPWIVCRHKDSPAPFANLTSQFGQVPVRARSWVRHLISLPDGDGTVPHAYNDGGNIALFNEIDHALTLFIHETAHSLDGLGAFTRTANLSVSSETQKWIDEYTLDDAVPDEYARTNQVENVAQASVVAAFNVNVPGGLASLAPKSYNAVFHQYATIQTYQREAGNLLVAGGICGKRLINSEPVRMNGGSELKSRVVGARAKMPNVDLAPELEVIEPFDFSTKDGCKHPK